MNLLSCVTGQKKVELVLDWKPIINAPKYYPMRTVSGSFSDGDKICFVATGGRLNNGWGESGM